MRFSPSLRLSLLVLILVPVYTSALWANLEIGVSPPRHEFSIGTGKTVVREIKVFNNSSTDTYSVKLSAGDCVASSTDGTPICRNYTGTGVDPKSLSSWIWFGEFTRFSIEPKKEKVVKITFTAPANALPGGHYGIVYFTPDVGQSTATVTMVRQLGVIFQVNVPGKIVYDIGLGDIEIDTPFFSAPDPLGEFMKTPKDPKSWSGVVNYLKTELNPFWNKPELVNSGDFNVKFTIPVSNSGNIDVRPIGRIELYDEDNTLLRRIGKESIKSQEWVYLGEKIVDYLPINDEGGSVLPDGDRKRIYTVDWKGFAYETLQDGKQVIKFQTPGEYYSALSANNASMLYPWEKLKISIATRHIKAKIALEYIGEAGKVVPMELERDIVVEYNYIDKVLNMGVILITVLIILIAWILIRRRDTRIDELEEENDELEEEIDEIEHAKQSARKILERKKNISLEKSITEKKIIQKAPVKKSPEKKNEQLEEAKAPVKKPRIKKVPPKKSFGTSKE